MYEIFVDNQVIHSDITPLESCKVLEPKLIMEDNSAGSLEFTVPPGNQGYNSINKLTSDIVVTEDGNELWRGRCIQETTDFWNNKKYLIEGGLAILNDSIQPPREFNVSNTTVRTFLEALIATHNNQMTSDNRKFVVGMVTVDDGDALADDDSIHRYTNYESTLECINQKLIEKLKGHLRVRWGLDGTTNTYRYILDYLKDYSTDATDQVIQFGHNLLDFTKSYNVTELVTAIIPRGARLDESPIAALEAYTTVASAATDGTWHTNGSIYVTNASAISTYGFICGVVDWDGVTDPANLLAKAKKYLQSVQFDKMSLEVSLVDLHYLNPNIESLKLLEQVHCISDPHGMDTMFPVTKMEIDLVNPSNTVYRLGTDVTGSLTAATNKISAGLLDYLNSTPSESALMTSAKKNAKALIEGTADGGYASFIFGLDEYGNAIIDPTDGETHMDRPTGIRVANAKNDTEATRRWVWTSGGLMHQIKNTSSNSWANSLPNAAITMDGKIVADYITAGTMSCDRLNGGVIRGQKIIGGSIFGTTIQAGTITSGKVTGTGDNQTVVTNDDQTDYGWVRISGGQLEVHNGTSGFARFTQAYKNSSDKAYKGEYCTIGGSRWYIHYYDDDDGRWHNQSFNTRGLIHVFQALIRNDWLDEDELY